MGTVRSVDTFKAELSGKHLAISTDLLENSGLNCNQYRVLLTGLSLCSHSTCTTKELLEKVCISRNTLTKVIAELEELGYCERETIQNVNGTFGGNVYIFREERKMSNPVHINSTMHKICARSEETTQSADNEQKNDSAMHKNCEFRAYTRFTSTLDNIKYNNLNYNSSKEEEKENCTYVHKETEVLPPPTPSSRFKKPTVEEIRAYISQKGYTEIDPEAFFLYYESNGWMVGKTKMKNWKAAIGTWHKKRNYGNNRQPTKEERDAAFARHIAEKLSRTPDQNTVDAF